MTFAWPTRLKYGLLAGLAGWLSGCLTTIPYVLSLAWRYVDARAGQMPETVVKGMVVWDAFSLFMAAAVFLPVVLPLFLLISPRWIVRWRRLLIPGVTSAALLAIYYRMGLLHGFYFRHPGRLYYFFITAPNLFITTFALVMIWVYIALAKRRLSASGVVPSQVHDPR
jgi:hypothetical protein